ncbi:hypothetical protein Val02_25280 [Virgisporangium aliadipatigenens]|uniref:Arginase n=1 Tax=Virgisporangium aliadipatigenens TaxID=741659 RepID=A0A8J4DQS8_9ACTN|nr:hypothetical protein Val02_25280 [Virgisporangium aliadipatigenens]
MRQIAILDAPTNLGLRPPTPTSVPGCSKAPGALRDQRLAERLAARDAGCLTPPRYDPGDWRPGDGVAHAEEIARYSVRLADRINEMLDAGEFPVVLGGDCSVLLGAGVALGRRQGRHGLVFVDGHSDFRHPGNASYVGAAAGEDLALVTGRGQADLTGIEGRRPYFRDVDVVVLGIRPGDEYRMELQAAGIAHRAVPELRSDGAARSAQWARNELADCDGYWVHIDVDVLDPAVMPAVDAPDPGGIAYAELELLIAGLVATPRCLGMELTVFDPDYDPEGEYAAEIVDMIVAGLSPVRAGAADPVGRRPRVPVARSAARSGFAAFAPAVVPVGAASTDPSAPDQSAAGPNEPVGVDEAYDEDESASGDAPEVLDVADALSVVDRAAVNDAAVGDVAVGAAVVDGAAPEGAAVEGGAAGGGDAATVGDEGAAGAVSGAGAWEWADARVDAGAEVAAGGDGAVAGGDGAMAGADGAVASGDGVFAGADGVVVEGAAVGGLSGSAGDVAAGTADDEAGVSVDEVGAPVGEGSPLSSVWLQPWDDAEVESDIADSADAARRGSSAEGAPSDGVSAASVSADGVSTERASTGGVSTGRVSAGGVSSGGAAADGSSSGRVHGPERDGATGAAERAVDGSDSVAGGSDRLDGSDRTDGPGRADGAGRAVGKAGRRAPLGAIPAAREPEEDGPTLTGPASVTELSFAIRAAGVPRQLGVVGRPADDAPEDPQERRARLRRQARRAADSRFESVQAPPGNSPASDQPDAEPAGRTPQAGLPREIPPLEGLRGGAPRADGPRRVPPLDLGPGRLRRRPDPLEALAARDAAIGPGRLRRRDDEQDADGPGRLRRNPAADAADGPGRLRRNPAAGPPDGTAPVPPADPVGELLAGGRRDPAEGFGLTGLRRAPRPEPEPGEEPNEPEPA